MGAVLSVGTSLCPTTPDTRQARRGGHTPTRHLAGFWGGGVDFAEVVHDFRCKPAPAGVQPPFRPGRGRPAANRKTKTTPDGGAPSQSCPPSNIFFDRRRGLKDEWLRKTLARICSFPRRWGRGGDTRVAGAAAPTVGGGEGKGAAGRRGGGGRTAATPPSGGGSTGEGAVLGVRR